MRITTHCRVTLGTLVLLDWDDHTQEESDLARDFIPRRVDLLRAPFSRQLSGSNVAHAITFSRVKRCASVEIARSLKFSLTAALPLVPATLTIQLHQPGSEVWTMAEALVQPGFKIRSECEWLKASYTIIGGQLTQTVQPVQPPALATEGGEVLTTEDGAAIEPE